MLADTVDSAPLSGRLLLAGYGSGERGPYLVLDDLAREPWQRQRFFVRGRTFSLSCLPERHCTGRYDLGSGRADPCPLRAGVADAAHEQCLPCFVATGFNPAFYNASEVSEQQRRRNREPHVVYLASFGLGALKVGMTFAPRWLSRLLEQGARLGAVVASLPDAGAARELEAAIARDFGVAESVRSARKRQLLDAPFAPEAARAELGARLEAVRAAFPAIARPSPIEALDRHHFGAEGCSGPLHDLSATEPLAISGRCLGMAGDVLVAAQGGRRFMLSVGGGVGHRVQLDHAERDNRFVGQLGLPF